MALGVEEMANAIRKGDDPEAVLRVALSQQAETHATWAEQMSRNEADGYYGQACSEVAAAIRAGAPVILPLWSD